MSRIIKDNWIRNTCRVINDRGSGTGFFLRDDKMKIYLVTNKHVIHPNKKDRDSIREINLDINVINNKGLTERDEIRFPFDDNSYREHNDLDTDVYILDVTRMFPMLNKEYGLKPDHYAAPGISFDI